MPTSWDRTEPGEEAAAARGGVRGSPGLPGKGVAEFCFIPVQAGSDKQVQRRRAERCARQRAL